MKSILIFSFGLLCATFVSAQELMLPQIFGDHMVLQRSQPVRFWGEAATGHVVKITIDSFEVTTKADNAGHWEVLYPAHIVGGPFSVTVSSGNTITYNDVWFGDVWVASGQSNMEWQLGWQVNNYKAEIADSDYPQIRFFEVEKKIALSPQAEVTGGPWVLASPETSPKFSAVAWFFAKQNHLDKKVPVGIISSYWGGTPAEAWTSAQRLLEVPGYKKAAAEMLDKNIDWVQRMKENQEKEALKWKLIEDEETFLKLGVQLPDYDDSDWQTVDLPTGEPMHNFVWVRKAIDIKSPQDAQLYLGEINQVCHVFFNGEVISQEGWQDTTAVVDIPKNLIKKGKNEITIRAVNSWDNNVQIGRPGEMWLQVGKNHIDLEGAWKFSNSLEPNMPEVEFFNWRPGLIYNTMISPIAGYTMQGVIWYQGENNADKPQYYNELFETMIEDWRIKWREGNFPFLYVQLANYMARRAEPVESKWAELRDAQTQTLELPNTGMATIIDIGEANNIHPHNKKDVGVRLWLAAKKVAFYDDVVSSGPMFKSLQVKEGKIEISYENVGGGLLAVPNSSTLSGFAIAGADKKYVWAQADIKGNKVIVWSDTVENPKYLRYAWADNPECNLYNKEGLPAVPFSSEE